MKILTLSVFSAHWNDLSNLDVDLSLFRPVYSPKDFLEVLSQLHSPNHVQNSLSLLGKPFGLIQVPLKTASLDDLIERFAELSRADPHLGVSPGAPSGDDPSLTLEQERYQLGVKVYANVYHISHSISTLPGAGHGPCSLVPGVSQERLSS